MISEFFAPWSVGPYAFREVPIRIWQGEPGAWALTEFNERSVQSACLRCPETPCARYSTEEASERLVIDISPHPTRDVCPWSAIEPTSDGYPAVDRDACTSCGLCVTRCPVGAIAWGGDGTAEVQIELSDLHVEGSVADHLQARAAGSAVNDQSQPSPAAWDLLRNRFDLNLEFTAPDRLRIVGRNFLRALGAKAHASTRGDTVDRAELTFSIGSMVWLAEIEPGSDLLGAVRRTMAAVAVAAARRGVPRDQLRSAVFVVGMPNSRSDGYRLLADLSSVLALDIAVLPLSALQMALLGHRSANLSNLLDAVTGLGIDPERLDVAPAALQALDLPDVALGRTDLFAPLK